MLNKYIVVLKERWQDVSDVLLWYACNAVIWIVGLIAVFMIVGRCVALAFAGLIVSFS